MCSQILQTWHCRCLFLKLLDPCVFYQQEFFIYFYFHREMVHSCAHSWGSVRCCKTLTSLEVGRERFSSFWCITLCSDCEAHSVLNYSGAFCKHNRYMHSTVAVWLYLSSLWVYSLTEAICNQKPFIWRGTSHVWLTCRVSNPKKSDVKATYICNCMATHAQNLSSSKLNALIILTVLYNTFFVFALCTFFWYAPSTFVFVRLND